MTNSTSDLDIKSDKGCKKIINCVLLELYSNLNDYIVQYNPVFRAWIKSQEARLNLTNVDIYVHINIYINVYFDRNIIYINRIEV